MIEILNWGEKDPETQKTNAFDLRATCDMCDTMAIFGSKKMSKPVRMIMKDMFTEGWVNVSKDGNYNHFCCKTCKDTYFGTTPEPKTDKYYEDWDPFTKEGEAKSKGVNFDKIQTTEDIGVKDIFNRTVPAHDSGIKDIFALLDVMSVLGGFYDQAARAIFEKNTDYGFETLKEQPIAGLLAKMQELVAFDILNNYPVIMIIMSEIWRRKMMED